MASRYPQPASITAPARRAERAGLALVLVLALSASVIPAAVAAPTLQPYSAQYKTTARGIGMTVTRKLEVSNDDSFVLTNGGKILVVGFHEVSVFHLQDAQIKPESYIYQGTGLVNRRRELHFRPESGLIDSLYKDRWYQLPYSETTVDRMSQLEQLRLTLMAGAGQREQIVMQVADGKRVKTSHLELVGEEILETPLGKVDTLHYRRLHRADDRSSDIWVAPDWDYLMVRTLHVEDGDPVELMIDSATIGGRAIVAR